jgi:hypothetical protein
MSRPVEASRAVFRERAVPASVTLPEPQAPRANWKGYLRLSLVSCPILLYPATSETEKVHFHQLNKGTGNRIHFQKVDAETGDVVPADDIVKGYEVGKGKGYVEVRWPRFPGQNGGLAKVDSGFDYATNFSSLACVA